MADDGLDGGSSLHLASDGGHVTRVPEVRTEEGWRELRALS